MAKVLTGWLQPQVAPHLCKFAGPDQYAVIANHTLRTFRDVAMLEKWSTAIVYLDQSKAFDLAWCSDGLVLWKCRLSEAHSCFVDLVLMKNHLGHACLYERVHHVRSWGVHSAIRLLGSLHEQAWVQVGRGSDTEKIRLGPRRGGRQGCRFGPDNF